MTDSPDSPNSPDDPMKDPLLRKILQILSETDAKEGDAKRRAEDLAEQIRLLSNEFLAADKTHNHLGLVTYAMTRSLCSTIAQYHADNPRKMLKFMESLFSDMRAECVEQLMMLHCHEHHSRNKDKEPKQ